MRTPYLCGNWKMNKTVAEAVEFITQLKTKLSGIDFKKIDVGVGAPFTCLSKLIDAAKGTGVKIGAQNCFWEEKGAFTGEISPLMLKDIGCDFVIIGHSERRQYFGETNETINKKINALLKVGLPIIVCVGETLPEREAGKAESVVKDHLTGSLRGLTAEQLNHLVIAYEPVWAIGTGKTATPAQAQEIHAYTRKVLRELYNDNVAQAMRIQYGGSMNAANVKELMNCPDVDGGLIGGASLKADDFEKLIKF